MATINMSIPNWFLIVITIFFIITTCLNSVNVYYTSKVSKAKLEQAKLQAVNEFADQLIEKTKERKLENTNLV